MARTTDRQHISEAIRLGSLWRIDVITRHGLVLVTDYDERLIIRYGNANQVTQADYIHYDEHGKIVAHEPITKRKRETVLRYINQKDVNVA